MIENINLTTEEIDTFRSDLENSDVIEEEEIKIFQKIRDKSSVDTIMFAKLFLKAYDFFLNNQHSFKMAESKIKKLLGQYDYIDTLRELLEEYGDGYEIGSNFVAQRIKIHIDGKREEMNKLIKLLFQIIMEEE